MFCRLVNHVALVREGVQSSFIVFQHWDGGEKMGCVIQILPLQAPSVLSPSFSSTSPLLAEMLCKDGDSNCCPLDLLTVGSGHSLPSGLARRILICSVSKSVLSNIFIGFLRLEESKTLTRLKSLIFIFFKCWLCFFLKISSKASELIGESCWEHTERSLELQGIEASLHRQPHLLEIVGLRFFKNSSILRCLQTSLKGYSPFPSHTCSR